MAERSRTISPSPWWFAEMEQLVQMGQGKKPASDMRRQQVDVAKSIAATLDLDLNDDELAALQKEVSKCVTGAMVQMALARWVSDEAGAPSPVYLPESLPAAEAMAIAEAQPDLVIEAALALAEKRPDLLADGVKHILTWRERRDARPATSSTPVHKTSTSKARRIGTYGATEQAALLKRVRAKAKSKKIEHPRQPSRVKPTHGTKKPRKGADDSEGDGD